MKKQHAENLVGYAQSMGFECHIVCGVGLPFITLRRERCGTVFKYRSTRDAITIIQAYGTRRCAA